MQSELTPRSYADLLALVTSAPVVFSTSAQPPPQAAAATPQTPAPPAGGREQPAGEGEHAPHRPPTTAEADTYKERECLELLQLVVLGRLENGKVKIFSKYHRATTVISNPGYLRFEELLQIGGAPVRARVQHGITGEVPLGMYSFNDVKKAIAMVAGYREIASGDEAGSGCWAGRDDKDSIIIVGNSEAADWNGDKTLRRIQQPLARGRLLDFDQHEKNWYDFDVLRDLMQQAGKQEFRAKAMRDCISILERWQWKYQDNDPVVLTGLIFASWVQTIWEWRPQVSVIGPTSSGKSMFCRTARGIFGSLGKSCSDQSAAGFRQFINTSARIFFLDEFDAKDKQAVAKQLEILKLLRSSGRGDSIVRGQANQKATETHLQHIVWVLGIQIPSPDQADRNRFITAELQPPTKEKEGKLLVPEPDELADLGQRMLASAIYCAHEARRLALKIKDTRIPKIDVRIIENYSAPAAMLACVQGWGEDAARELLKKMIHPLTQGEHDTSTDEQDLVNAIFAARPAYNSRRCVGQLIKNVVAMGTGCEEDRELLESVGIGFGELTGREGAGAISGDKCILIAHGVVTEHLLKNTRWGGTAVQQILCRVGGPGVSWKSRRVVGGQNIRLVAIPLRIIANEFLLGDDEEKIPGAPKRDDLFG